MEVIIKITTYQNDIPSDFSLAGDLAIDTETMGLNIFERDRLCVLQFSVGDGDAYLVQFDGKDYSAPNLKKLLLDEERGAIFHYARFDIAVIKKYLNVEIKNIFCTKIASRLTRTYTDHHGLKALVKEMLKIEISKQQQSSNWGAVELSKMQKEYAAKDVVYLHNLRSELNEMLIAQGRATLAHDIFKFLPIRASLDLAGWQEQDIFSHNV